MDTWSQPPPEGSPKRWRKYGSHRGTSALARALQERHPAPPGWHWYVDLYKASEYGSSGRRVTLMLCVPWRFWKALYCSATEVLDENGLLAWMQSPNRDAALDRAAEVLLARWERDGKLEHILNTDDTPQEGLR